MAEVVWTPRALKDIDEIAAYIAKDSIQYAEEQVKIFFERAFILEKYPFIGRRVTELKIDSVRQILCGHYRIIYEVVHKELIGIITIHHQARLLKNNPAFKKHFRRRRDK